MCDVIYNLILIVANNGVLYHYLRWVVVVVIVLDRHLDHIILDLALNLYLNLIDRGWSYVRIIMHIYIRRHLLVNRIHLLLRHTNLLLIDWLWHLLVYRNGVSRSFTL